jgi:hypothetical protein
MRPTRAPAHVRVPEVASTGTDSPVSIEWSSSALPDTIRMSAATTPPSESLTTSPLTRSAAGTIDHIPSRSTEAFMARRDFNAASVACARLSCKTPRTALNTSSPAMIPASTKRPSTHCKITAASSIHGTGAQNFSSTMRHVLADGSGSTFVPDSARLRRTSVLLRPVLIAPSGWLAASMIGTGTTADVTFTPLCQNNLQPTRRPFGQSERHSMPAKYPWIADRQNHPTVHLVDHVGCGQIERKRCSEEPHITARHPHQT